MGIGNKLFKLKKFFTIEETAERLSLALGEDVSTVDILELAYDRHITISVIIEGKMFGVWAKLETTTYREMFNINDDGSYKSIFGNIEHMPIDVIDIEQEKGKSPKEYCNMEGAFLCYEDHFINVMALFENKNVGYDYTKERKRILVDKDTKEPITKDNYWSYFYPAGGLEYANGDQDIEFVFRRENIEKFEQSLLEEHKEIDYAKSQLLIASILKVLKDSNPKKWTQGELSDLISEQSQLKGLGKRKIDAFFSQCNKLLDNSIK